MKKLLEKLHTPNWLFWLLLVVLILRIPSFFEPYSYGDEMIYLTLGEAIRRGVPLYSGIHDNKPPLLYILAAIGGSLFWFKAILAVWHLVTVFIFWKLTEALFPKKPKNQIVSTIIFALLTTLPLFEGNIANAELFMVGPTILGFYLLLTKKLNFKNIFFSGVLFSVATLFKVPAAFDVPVIVFLWLATARLKIKNFKGIAKKTVILALGFSLPILLTFVWYYLQGAFREYLIAAFLQNVGYLSSWRPDDVREPFLVKNAPLLLRAGVVFFGLVILYWKRKKLSKEFLFATSWLLLSLFAVTLSERPYPHYLIQSVPPLAILSAMLFTYQNMEQVLVIIPLTIFAIVPVYFNFWHYPTTSYYVRFIKLSTGRVTREEYLQTFGGHIPRNYKIARYVASSSKKSDKIFVWGDTSIIYALTRRLPPIKYVADYHISDFSSPEDTVSKLTNDMPVFVVILPDAPDFPELEHFLNDNYGLVEEIEGARIWRLLTPGVRALLAR